MNGGTNRLGGSAPSESGGGFAGRHHLNRRHLLERHELGKGHAGSDQRRTWSRVWRLGSSVSGNGRRPPASEVSSIKNRSGMKAEIASGEEGRVGTRRGFPGTRRAAHAAWIPEPGVGAQPEHHRRPMSTSTGPSVTAALVSADQTAGCGADGWDGEADIHQAATRRTWGVGWNGRWPRPGKRRKLEPESAEALAPQDISTSHRLGPRG